MNIPFSPPDITDVEINAVVEVLRSGWITTGPKVKLLEQKLADYVGTEKCVCLNSQTACAELALKLLGIGPGDEVITSAYTYTASASIVCHVGAKLVLIDTAPDSFEMDYNQLEDAINKNTKAIIPIDLGGIPCDYDRIYEIVKRKSHLFKPNNDLQKAIGRVAVMADTAHSLGAIRYKKRTGSIADFSSFSFHAVKNFTTAEGGAITWNNIPGIDNEEIYRRFQLLSLHGQSKDALAKTKLGSWEYDIVGTYYKYNMTDIMGALGLGQLSRYENMLKRRCKIAEKYDNAFKKAGIYTLPHFSDNYTSCYHLYITRVPGINLDQRNEIIIKMAEKGISCNVHYKPLPMHTAYKNMGFDIKDYPNSYKFFENEITLPLHTLLTDEQVDYIIETYISIIGEYTK